MPSDPGSAGFRGEAPSVPGSEAASLQLSSKPTQIVGRTCGERAATGATVPRSPASTREVASSRASEAPAVSPPAGTSGTVRGGEADSTGSVADRVVSTGSATDGGTAVSATADGGTAASAATKGGAATPAPAVMSPTEWVPASGCCQVPGCKARSAEMKDYHTRYRICEQHLKAPCVTVSLQPFRFCQQCGRFQHLTEFDGDKRSCRERLARHNARRRRLREQHAATRPQRARGTVRDSPASAAGGLEPSAPPRSVRARVGTRRALAASKSGSRAEEVGERGAGPGEAPGASATVAGTGATPASARGPGGSVADATGAGGSGDASSAAADSRGAREDEAASAALPGAPWAWPAAGARPASAGRPGPSRPAAPASLWPSNSPVSFRLGRGWTASSYGGEAPWVQGIPLSPARGTFASLSPFAQEPGATSSALETRRIPRAAPVGRPTPSLVPLEVGSGSSWPSPTLRAAGPSAAPVSPTQPRSSSDSEHLALLAPELRTLSLKLYGCAPEDLPSDLLRSLDAFLDPSSIETHTSKGFLMLEAHAVTPPSQEAGHGRSAEAGAAGSQASQPEILPPGMDLLADLEAGRLLFDAGELSPDEPALVSSPSSPPFDRRGRGETPLGARAGPSTAHADPRDAGAYGRAALAPAHAGDFASFGAGLSLAVFPPGPAGRLEPLAPTPAEASLAHRGGPSAGGAREGPQDLRPAGGAGEVAPWGAANALAADLAATPHGELVGLAELDGPGPSAPMARPPGNFAVLHRLFQRLRGVTSRAEARLGSAVLVVGRGVARASVMGRESDVGLMRHLADLPYAVPAGSPLATPPAPAHVEVTVRARGVRQRLGPDDPCSIRLPPAARYAAVTACLAADPLHAAERIIFAHPSPVVISEARRLCDTLSRSGPSGTARANAAALCLGAISEAALVGASVGDLRAGCAAARAVLPLLRAFGSEPLLGLTRDVLGCALATESSLTDALVALLGSSTPDRESG